MTEMASRPAELVDAATKARFLKLFSIIVMRMTTALAAAARRQGDPG
ncbi:hypothetical protein [Methylorubrum extorquens]|jgi:hypothetical protein|uniref:Uncharacterized protein n=5 Tax=Methylorubrum extorquens TaxID=408 RepID=C5B3R4_METEA|nr:hypothetical protein [Methylorubrum extorquens]ACK81979.1 hypothetical protein Mchl_1077 [Methylorubrum extorquens CM4]ACS43096.1 conserved hypothetical protein [Methylorubrum extorquens AM1]EHP94611.1 hypothetical protein MetexDRAFT_0436 [Methylorubrum extorquens DSM 13060]MCG5248728.1 hypothetical protein [Methylorubrum extorquens]MCP1545863.1 hypothetical protein [Methylorubrum extorquens]